MDRSAQNHPSLIPFAELTERHEYARQLEEYIKTLFGDDFHLRTEHAVTILLVSLKLLAPNGSLSAESGPREGFSGQSQMKSNLNCIRMFCKHYMLHLDPSNLIDPAWASALYKTPDFDCENDWDFDDPEVIYARLEAQEFEVWWRTDPSLQDFPRDIDVEKKCVKRDGNRCIVTGKALDEPKIFWFVPSTWNDTVQHNDATGNLALYGSYITGPYFATRSNPFYNRHQLGGSHKAWNMLCIDPSLYKLLAGGLCALRYSGDTKLESGKVEVTLQFYWMSQLKGRFGQITNTETDCKDLIEEIQTWHDKGYPPPSSYDGNLTTKWDEPLRSGHLIHMAIPEEDLKHLKSALDIHWTCVVFTALCGGSGRAHLLSGRRFEWDVI